MTENFVSRMEKEIAELKTDLLQLRVAAELADLDRQNDYYRLIEEIVVRENAVREKLGMFSAADPEARSLQKEIEELWQDTKEALEVAKAKIFEF